MDQERLYKNDNKVNYPDQNKGCSGNKNPEESLSLDKKGEESMAYSELVKNFNHIREYMREFYVYGFKSRDEYTRKSARSYDDERRRLESWLGDYMKFIQTPSGKILFLSIDSRRSYHNPFYKAWKTKSFTDGDITLHFILMDLLEETGQAMSVAAIVRQVDIYLSEFKEPKIFDESTIRKKLNEYVREGSLITEKRGKILYYKKGKKTYLYNKELLDFFSETAPCGVIGSFLLDNKKIDTCHQNSERDYFAFKHHYITSALDSEILCRLFEAIQEKRVVHVKNRNRHKEGISKQDVVPLQIRISVQNGRQYLMAYVPQIRRIRSLRIDHIFEVTLGEKHKDFDVFREKWNKMKPYMWGVSTQSRSGARMEHIEFTVQYGDFESYIHKRLEREKRCGTVTRIDRNTSHFSADVFDSSELIPWIRTFIGRITEIHFSDPKIEEEFFDDLESMYRMYGLESSE